MSIKRIGLILSSALLWAAASVTQATVIDFEGASGTASTVGSYIDVGEYRFTLSASVSSGFEVVSGQSNLIEGNTTKLFVANHAEMTLSRVDGGAFNLNSLDIAGSWIDSPSRWADHVDLIGGIDTFTANLAGTSPTYQNVSPGFVGVTSVLFRPFGNVNGGVNNYEFIVDNIDVTTAAISEPSVIALLALGLIGVRLRRR